MPISIQSRPLLLPHLMHSFAPYKIVGCLKAYHLLMLTRDNYCLLRISLVKLIVVEREQISKMARKYLASHDLSFIKALLLCTLEEIRNKSLIVLY